MSAITNGRWFKRLCLFSLKPLSGIGPADHNPGRSIFQLISLQKAEELKAPHLLSAKSTG
ncbi:Hypothetical protein FKW44_014880 [Caligus rogercresseyi]|uniref:Uncharacterized protein n=1 Tax=Caligus rogercresseyi TaxID=217165 RepID=A0A7T8JZB5_CALRO|nr:Hypothetical protein FKW44_014880 [Caligus rogercresseyi]